MYFNHWYYINAVFSTPIRDLLSVLPSLLNLCIMVAEIAYYSSEWVKYSGFVWLRRMFIFSRYFIVSKFLNNF